MEGERGSTMQSSLCFYASKRANGYFRIIPAKTSILINSCPEI
jgi:hypothetical protein